MAKNKKELPYFDNEGRIINSHKFKEAGEFYNKHKFYTLYPPNSSTFHKFWEAEKEKCLHGVKLGEVYITGYNYFFLNYYRMTVSKELPNGVVVTIEDFPKFLTLHWNMFNLIEYCDIHKKNLVLTKPRGAGISEVFASLSVRDFFFSDSFEGQKIFNQNAYFASKEQYIMPKHKGSIMEKVNAAIDWLNNYDIKGDYLYQPSLYNNDTGRKAGIKKMNGSDYVDVSTGATITIKHIPKDKSDNARGNRQDKILFEESGTFPDLVKTLGVALPLLERLGVKTGTAFVWGTTGVSDEGLEGLRYLFYNPTANDFLCFDDVYESVLSEKDLVKIPYDYRKLIRNDKSGVGLFLPIYDTNLNFTDEHGNPKRVEAYQNTINRRKEKEKTENLYSFISEYPLKPSEAFKKSGSNFFPSELLGKQLMDLTLHKTKKLPKCYTISNNTIYENITVTEVNKSGLQILEHPEKNIDGSIDINKYVIGYDGIDMGNDESEVGSEGSKMCAIVFKRYSNMDSYLPVAMYFERPNDARSGFEVVYKLSLYYNAKIMIEDTKRGLYAYVRDVKKKPNLFFKRPKSILNGKAQKDKIGFTASQENIKKYLELIMFYVQDNYENLHFVELVEQLLQYKYEEKTKFDTVAAFGAALLAHENAPLSNVKEEIESSYYYGWYTDKNGVKKFGKIVIEQKQTNREVSYFDIKNNMKVYER